MIRFADIAKFSIALYFLVAGNIANAETPKVGSSMFTDGTVILQSKPLSLAGPIGNLQKAAGGDAIKVERINLNNMCLVKVLENVSNDGQGVGLADELMGIQWVRVRVDSGENKGKEGYLKSNELIKGVDLVSAKWVPIDSNASDESFVDVRYSVNEFQGDFEIRLAFVEGTLNDRPNLPIATPLISDDLVAKEEVIAKRSVSGRSREGSSCRIAIGKGTPSVRPIRLFAFVVYDTPASDRPEIFSRVELTIQEPHPLSFELQHEAPLANTRKDRVQLWVRRHLKAILKEAEENEIACEMIVAPIAWEALENVRESSFRASGPGKVHASDSVFDAAIKSADRGIGVARQVEDLGLLPIRSVHDRFDCLKSSEESIKYIAAIMGSYIRIAKDVYSAEGKAVPFDGPHKDNTPLLCNFFQGLKPAVLGFHMDLLNCRIYFESKAKSGGAYQIRQDPKVSMDAWAQANINYLKLVISDPGLKHSIR